MTDCKVKMDNHWKFLKEFISIIVYDSPNIVMSDEQVDAFEEEMKSIEYGFKLSWPHAWKHGESSYEDKMRLKYESTERTKGDKFG